ncbi:MAG: CAP domain-containing protein [Acidobacteriota bacterium]
MRWMRGCATLALLTLGLTLWLWSRAGTRSRDGAGRPMAEPGSTAIEPEAPSRPEARPRFRPTPAEQRVFDATNAERSQHGLPPLAPEPTLGLVARGHSDDMLRRGYFSHTSPDGDSAGDRVASQHRRLVGLAGENIWTGSGYGATAAPVLARLIVESWMSSPGHRANILRPESTHLGVGIVTEGREVRATQVFATVYGFLAEPLPATVRRGAKLVPGTVAGAKGQAERFDLFSVRRGAKVGGPWPLSGTTVDASPGTYQLRVYFPEGARRFVISNGPRIEVR